MFKKISIPLFEIENIGLKDHSTAILHQNEGKITYVPIHGQITKRTKFQQNFSWEGINFGCWPPDEYQLVAYLSRQMFSDAQFKIQQH